LLYIFLAVFVGALTAIQSRANGELSIAIGNNFAAALLSQTVAWFFLLPLIIFPKKSRAALKKSFHAFKTKDLRFWEITGGFIGGSFLSIQSYTVPAVGVAIFTIATVAGQTSTSLLIDKWGIGPAGKKAINSIRVFSALLTIVAVIISVIPDLRGTNIKWLPLVLALAIGCLLSLQQALNGRVTHFLKEPIATSFYNFLFGTIVILIGLAISLFNGGHFYHLPTNIWLYIGGPCGLIFIAVSAVIVKHLGVLNYILGSVFGSLVGAILLDWLIPAHKGALTNYLLVGSLITLVAIAILKFSDRKVNEVL
jgi:transporter family-2 protein